MLEISSDNDIDDDRIAEDAHKTESKDTTQVHQNILLNKVVDPPIAISSCEKRILEMTRLNEIRNKKYG